ncbi:hypothetical protein [Carp edema virus]|nr:hypothetical protein [Carp edema virus]
MPTFTIKFVRGFCAFDKSDSNSLKIEFIKPLATISLNKLNTFYTFELMINLESLDCEFVSRFGYVNQDEFKCFINERRNVTEIDPEVIRQMYSEQITQDEKIEILKNVFKDLEKDFRNIKSGMYCLYYTQAVLTGTHGSTLERDKTNKRSNSGTLKNSKSFLSLFAKI